MSHQAINLLQKSSLLPGPCVLEGQLRIEPRGVVNTGDAGGERTVENDVWI